MTFWNRYRRGIIWLAFVIGAIGLAAYLSSCAGAREQPPCPDCYLMVPKGDPRHD